MAVALVADSTLLEKSLSGDHSKVYGGAASPDPASVVVSHVQVGVVSWVGVVVVRLVIRIGAVVSTLKAMLPLLAAA